MNQIYRLTLKDGDPRVAAALQAERRLFMHYGLQAQTHFVRMARYDIRLRVLEIGAGAPLLVVPGNVGEVFPLAPLLAQLPGRRIIAVNRPGGGGSEGVDFRDVDFRQFAVESLTSVLDTFGLERAPVMAHSIGGHMSLWLALDRPERVSALSLLGVPGNILGTQPPAALRLMAVPGLNRVMLPLIRARSVERALRGLAFMGHSPETLARLPGAMAECYYAFPRLPHASTASLSMMEQSNHLFRADPDSRIGPAQLGRIRQPVQFLWGTRDPFGSAEIGRRAAVMAPAGQFQAIQEGGHLPWLDQPELCGRLVGEFLQGM
jgi:2-hydroxy-6-oxonona-2,4-dienedioate hydrolase